MVYAQHGQREILERLGQYSRTYKPLEQKEICQLMQKVRKSGEGNVPSAMDNGADKNRYLKEMYFDNTKIREENITVKNFNNFVRLRAQGGLVCARARLEVSG